MFLPIHIPPAAAHNPIVMLPTKFTIKFRWSPFSNIVTELNANVEKVVKEPQNPTVRKRPML